MIFFYFYKSYETIVENINIIVTLKIVTIVTNILMYNKNQTVQ